MWTQFWDMHTRGVQKTQWAQIYIEADCETALRLFLEGFGRDPLDSACSCCGQDYSIDEYETLAEATAYQRHCDWEGDNVVERQDPEITWATYQTLEEYEERDDVLILRADQLPRLKAPSIFSAL